MSTPVAYTRTGPELLGDTELLAVALGDRALAAALLDDLAGAAGLLQAPPAALARTLGATRAARLHATFALARRVQAEPPRRARVASPSDAAAWLAPRLTALGHEELHALFLDRRGCAVAVRRMSQGSADHTLFDVRHLLGEALRVGAQGLIVAHNHPSGDPEPSTEDLIVTRRLAEGAALLGLDLQDHLIVAPGRWVSLAERGELPRATVPATRFPSA